MEEISELLEHELSDAVEVKDAGSFFCRRNKQDCFLPGDGAVPDFGYNVLLDPVKFFFFEKEGKNCPIPFGFALRIEPGTDVRFRYIPFFFEALFLYDYVRKTCPLEIATYLIRRPICWGVFGI